MDEVISERMYQVQENGVIVSLAYGRRRRYHDDYRGCDTAIQAIGSFKNIW